MILSKILDDKNNYNMDKNSIGNCLGSFAKQCSDALFLGRNLSIPLKHNVDYIFLCGVGGSGLAGAFVKNIALKYGSIPIFIVRDYALPAFATEKSLAIILSYSGNTEEALSCYDDAKKIKCSLAAVTTEGKLGEFAEKDGIFLIKVPLGFQPRMAILHMALPVLLLLTNEELIKLPHEEIGEIYFNLGRLSKKWGWEIPAVNNRAKTTALQLYNKIPIIWGSQGLTDIGARNMKAQLNETAKMPCFWGSIPEVNHNEIMSFNEEKPNFALLLFRDESEHPRVARRFELSAAMLKDNVAIVSSFKGQGGSVLSRLAEGIYFGDLIGYYLSILNQVNPEEIAMITSFKARMSR